MARTPLSVLFALSLAALAVVACKQDAAAPSDTTPPPVTTAPTPATPGPASPDPMFACASDADCKVVEMGCCDHCNGGWQLSVNAAHLDAATAKYHEQNCGGACTERGCDWNETPICDAGTCSRTEDRDGDPSTPATTTPNQIPTK